MVVRSIFVILLCPRKAVICYHNSHMLPKHAHSLSLYLYVAMSLGITSRVLVYKAESDTKKVWSSFPSLVPPFEILQLPEEIWSWNSKCIFSEDYLRLVFNWSEIHGAGAREGFFLLVWKVERMLRFFVAAPCKILRYSFLRRFNNIKKHIDNNLTGLHYLIVYAAILFPQHGHQKGFCAQAEMSLDKNCATSGIERVVWRLDQ